MKKIFTHLSLAITLLLCTFSLSALAQVTQAPFTGPSDATTAPPTTMPTAGVDKVQCSTDAILLQSPTGVAGTTYQWYKIQKDPTTGVETSVPFTANQTLQDQPNAAGYYKYKLVYGNALGCTSAASPVYTVYVLPALSPQVQASTVNICPNNQTSSQLTISPALDSRFTYTYVWKKDGTAITGATLDHYTVSEATPGTYGYTVTVSYSAFSTVTCSGTSTPVSITVAPVIAAPVITFGN